MKQVITWLSEEWGVPDFVLTFGLKVLLGLVILMFLMLAFIIFLAGLS